MNEGIGGDFGYSHGAAQKDLDTIITGGRDLVVVFLKVYLL